MIKAITFDLDGVYFTVDSFLNFKKLLPITITDPSKIDILSKSEEMMSFKRGGLTENQFWDFVRKELDVNISNQEIFDLLYQAYETNQNVVNYVKKVRSEGIKTCICTNNFPTRINALNKKFNFLSDFDVQVFSYEVGSVKPDLKIFQTLIEKSGVLPQEIFYADDKESNVEAAKSLGINAIVFTNFEDFVKSLTSLT